MKKIIILALLIAPITMFAQKFGHCNTMEIMEAMPEYAAATTELQTLGQTYQKELQTMQEELTRKGKEYEALRDSASVPESILKRHEQNLQTLYENFQNSQQNFQEEIDKMRVEKLQAIQQKVVAAIKEVGDAGGYVYIMDTNAGIPYISSTLSTDITAQVKTKLGIK